MIAKTITITISTLSIPIIDHLATFTGASLSKAPVSDFSTISSTCREIRSPSSSDALFGVSVLSGGKLWSPSIASW